MQPNPTPTDTTSDPLGLIPRLVKRSEVDSNGCWLWLGPLDRKGYGKINARRRTHAVHRSAYLILGASFDPSLTLDHLCRVRNCWNPEHLEPVTNRENIRRGEGWAGVNAKRTHCQSGHEYTAENTRLRVRADRGGSIERDCKQCQRRWKANQQRKRAA